VQVSPEEERQLEMTWVKLQQMEENTRKLYKEVKKYEECLAGVQKADEKLSSQLTNSRVGGEGAGQLARLTDQYQSIVYQMGHNTEDLAQLCHKTVLEPVKKLSNEFPQVQAAVKRRDLALQEAQRAQAKHEKLAKLENTGANVAKREQAKQCSLLAREDFEKANKLLLLELPQFHDRRVDYFQPCLQALIRAQVDYYGESTRLHRQLGVEVGQGAGKEDEEQLQTDEEYERDLERKLQQIKALSIVGS